MTAERVLAAAAALREFTLDDLAACSDEQPPAIETILRGAGERIQPVDAAPAPARWRVIDLDGLRRDLARRAGTAPPGHTLDDPRRRVSTPSTTRLLLAEQTLCECAAAESADERRTLVATAKNHLRQVLAGVLPERSPWWSRELSLQRLGEAIELCPDQPACTRLRLNVALACLAEGDATGRPVPLAELVHTVLEFQRLAALLEEPELRGLVGRFFDLVMAQLAPPDRNTVAAPDRLLAAVARRRVRAQVEHGVGVAMHSLVPLLESLGDRQLPAPEQGLCRVLGRLPDGRDRVLVYTDLLQILPRQYLWQPAAELMPGALIEAVTEPLATTRLTRCAEALEHDLVRSPFSSDAALIGQVAHIFQILAEQATPLDGTVQARSDRTRTELLALAKAPGWPALRARREKP